MKNKVLIGSLITTLLAFMLYSFNLKRVQTADVKIVGQSEKQVTQKNKGNIKTPREPNVAAVEYTNHIKVASGSNKAWAKKIQKVMGKDQSYQVCVQDLNSGKFARVYNTEKAHGINSVSRLYILAAMYYQIQHGKLNDKKAVKVKKADRAKGEKMLQPGIAYAITYLKQSMMRGSHTAGNVLLRKIKPVTVGTVVKKMGAKNTKFSGKYATSPIAMSTAQDLAAVMSNLYQNKSLDQQYSNLVLGALNLTGKKPKVVSGIKGQIYGIGDTKANVAIVQNNGHAFCVSVWSNDNRSFAKLGKTVSDFFK